MIGFSVFVVVVVVAVVVIVPAAVFGSFLLIPKMSIRTGTTN